MIKSEEVFGMCVHMVAPTNETSDTVDNTAISNTAHSNPADSSAADSSAADSNAADRGDRSVETAPNGEPLLPQPNTWIELAKQIVLVGLAVLFYFAVRGITEGSAATAIDHGRDVMALEQRLGIALEPASQDSFANNRTLTTIANWVYIWGHWPVIAVTLIWLHERHRYHYLLLRNAMFISGAIGLVIFVSYPVAPPRLIGAGFVDTVTEMSTSYRVLQPPSLVNKYAAIPSLHVGWNLLVGLALWRISTTWRHRLVAVSSPVLMTLAVLFTANHYLLDAVAGAVVALVGLAIAHRITLPLALRDLTTKLHT